MSSISVVIPSWNRAPLLGKAIASVLAQTLSPLEILICDDGSTDESEAIVRGFNSPLIHWLAGPRSGRAAVARNRGIARASGDWIAFLDSDDFWMPRKLERQMRLIEQTGLRAGCTDALVYDPAGKVTGARQARGSGPVCLSRLLRGNAVLCSSAIVHRTILAQTGGFPEDQALRLGQDYALWLRVAAFTDFARVAEPLVGFLDHPGNTTRQYPSGENAGVAGALAAARWGRSAGLGAGYQWAMWQAGMWARLRPALRPLESRLRRPQPPAADLHRA